MTRVFIIGNKGNMGKRYAACLDYLEIEHWGWDKPIFNHDYRTYKGEQDAIRRFYDTLSLSVSESSHCIVATPTYRHKDDIEAVKNILCFEGPILCEKPITKQLSDLKDLNLDNLYMVNNYQYIANKYQMYSKQEYPTRYDYYHSGNDGLAWDCIQLFKFSDTPILDNKSPIWKCVINSREISKDEIDRSYIDMLKDFTGPMDYVWDKETIIDLHLKVAKYEIENSNRNTSKND